MKITKASEHAESIAERLEACRLAVESKKEIKSTEHGKESQIRHAEIIGRIPKRAERVKIPENPVVQEIIGKLRESKGIIILTGPNRTGKTTVSANVAKYWPGKSAYWTSAWQLLQDIKETFNSKANYRIPTHSLMVIDEFDKFNGSEWAETVLDRTVCTRYDDEKPTLIITNADKSTLSHICSNALLARLKECNGIVELNKPYWNE